jgi:hypothetical protein
MENSIDWTAVIFGLPVILGFIAVIIVVIWQIFATYRARMSVAREQAYRDLAAKAIEIDQRSADGIDRALRELIEIRSRTTELERLLKEVG